MSLGNLNPQSHQDIYVILGVVQSKKGGLLFENLKTVATEHECELGALRLCEDYMHR